jgi:FlaA1/EpsC-like NDP-sugar epimerase
MREKLLNYRTVPRWVIQLIDLVIISWSFTLSYFIIQQFEFKEIYRGHFFIYIGLYCGITISVFYFKHIHTGLIRYSNSQDIFRIFSAIIISSIIYPLLIELIFITGVFSIAPLALGKLLLINFFISSSVLVLLRTAVKEMFHFAKRITTNTKERILIYGSDNRAIIVKQALESSDNDAFTILGFVETNRSRVNSYIEQKKVFHINDLQKLKEKFNADKLIMMNEELGNTAI